MSSWVKRRGPHPVEVAERTRTVARRTATELGDARLADALQDAGCDNADILDHCRGRGSHVRGCWVVDLVLGKESHRPNRSLHTDPAICSVCRCSPVVRVSPWGLGR
jgi:hypothetical protein